MRLNSKEISALMSFVIVDSNRAELLGPDVYLKNAPDYLLLMANGLVAPTQCGKMRLTSAGLTVCWALIDYAVKPPILEGTGVMNSTTPLIDSINKHICQMDEDVPLDLAGIRSDLLDAARKLVEMGDRIYELEGTD